ncbi:MAG TPA: hypothetical protein VMS94_06835 [Acidobacteriota bacterium]|nr:hypothetical protein [Acidobacteriota bacterium]
MQIIIPDDDLREGLEAWLETKVSNELLEEFKRYLEGDLTEWIRQNFRAFHEVLSHNGRLERIRYFLDFKE